MIAARATKGRTPEGGPDVERKNPVHKTWHDALMKPVPELRGLMFVTAGDETRTLLELQDRHH